MNKRKILIEHDDGNDVSIFEGRVTRNEEEDKRVEVRYYIGDCTWETPWRGSVAASLKDNGMGDVEIKLHNSDKEIQLDHDDIIDLLVLLSYYKENSGLSEHNSTFKKFKED